MHVKTAAFTAAFPLTIPVLTGYLFLGAGYGILMSSKGIAIGWTVLMSVIVFAGSLQYVAITLLTAAFQPLTALLLALMVNARHLFYGLSMLGKYQEAGTLKRYLIFGLTDETFSLLAVTEPAPGIDRRWYYFFVTLLNHSYWIAGSALGAVAGALVRFDTKGLDFVLTALFVVLFVEQWKQNRCRIPSVIGIAGTVAALLLFGPERFMLPAMVLLLAVLTLARPRLDPGPIPVSFKTTESSDPERGGADR